jgi:hypothetical protein
MRNRYRAAAALLALGVLTAHAGEAEHREQNAQTADGFAHLHGFGEGVAAVLETATPVRQSRQVEGAGGKVLLKTYRQPGIELKTMSASGRTLPDSLTISRAGYALPLGLRIGDLRGAVERTLGAPDTGGATLVLKRSQGEGCADPIVLTFRNNVLAQVAWTWESCMD